MSVSGSSFLLWLWLRLMPLPSPLRSHSIDPFIFRALLAPSDHTTSHSPCIILCRREDFVVFVALAVVAVVVALVADVVAVAFVALPSREKRAASSAFTRIKWRTFTLFIGLNAGLQTKFTF